MIQHDDQPPNKGQPEITGQDRQRANEIKERIDRDIEQKSGWGKGPGGTNMGSGDYAHPGPVNDLGTDQYTNSGEGVVRGRNTDLSRGNEGTSRNEGEQG